VAEEKVRLYPRKPPDYKLELQMFPSTFGKLLEMVIPVIQKKTRS
jgi:hypothetical protein